MSFFTVVSIFERIFFKKPVHSVLSFFSGRFSVFCRNRLTLINNKINIKPGYYKLYVQIAWISIADVKLRRFFMDKEKL